MPDPTPTSAPALTDEQIDAARESIRRDYGIAESRGTSAGMYAAHDDFDTWYAAVIAKAKREAAEEIAQAIEVVDPIEWALAGQSAGQDAATIARKVGATR